MSSRYLLMVALVFSTGLAAGVCVNRYALREPASIPAAKLSVREQILGRWDAISKDGKSVFEFGPDNSITFIGSGEEHAFSYRWFDDEHIGLSGPEQMWMRVTLSDDHLTLDPGKGEIIKCKRAATPPDHPK